MVYVDRDGGEKKEDWGPSEAGEWFKMERGSERVEEATPLRRGHEHKLCKQDESIRTGQGERGGRSRGWRGRCAWKRRSARRLLFTARVW